MIALLREPLVHFLAGGAFILLLFSLFDDTPQRIPENVLEITEEDVGRLVAQFEATWRRAPTEAELSSLVDQLIRREILVREALALGLDQGDELVRLRLVQKMMVLAEGGVAALAATDDVLAAHMAEHRDRFERPPTVAFTQIVLRDGASPEDAISVLAEGGDLATIASPTLLPYRLPPTPQMIVDRTFGSGFFDALADVKQNAWSGAIDSPFGRHMVYVESITPGLLPTLDEVRDAVELDWRARRRDALVEERINALVARYKVERPENLSGSME